MREMVTFVGELTVALGYALLHPRSIRRRDFGVAAETAAVNSLPIVLLIGFIIGLVMAFQAAVPMRQFGVEIFVADLVALSMLRELGPLMTAVILAGRSGSAFAAELGTMRINEEINALTTMGIDPVRFLVVVRVLAVVLLMPLLVLFADLVGLIGGDRWAEHVGAVKLTALQRRYAAHLKADSAAAKVDTARTDTVRVILTRVVHDSIAGAAASAQVDSAAHAVRVRLTDSTQRVFDAFTAAVERRDSVRLGTIHDLQRVVAVQDSQLVDLRARFTETNILLAQAMGVARNLAQRADRRWHIGAYGGYGLNVPVPSGTITAGAQIGVGIIYTLF